MKPRRVGPADLQIPDPPVQRAEAAVGLVVPVSGQVALGGQRHVHAFVEVLPGLAVASAHVVSD